MKFSFDPESIVSFPLYMVKAIQIWCAKQNILAFKVACTPHLFDPEITTILCIASINSVVSSLAVVFAKHSHKIKRNYAQILDERELNRGLPKFKKSTRAWGSIYRTIMYLTKEIKIDEDYFSKLELINIFLLEIYQINSQEERFPLTTLCRRSTQHLWNRQVDALDGSQS